MEFRINYPILGLPLVIFVILLSNAKCLNTTKRYFITIGLSDSNQYATNTRRSLGLIQNTLCATRSRFDPTPSVTCFLTLKVVGEPRVIVVADVLDSAELERRLTLLLRSSAFQYESEPVVGYENFARLVLGVNDSLAILDGNTLENIQEALWCEFNINFGDKNATEIISIWKREAEVVFQTRKSGVPLEIFKTVGERTVHLLVELDATTLDQIFFGTPFNQEIPNTLKTTCKPIVKLKNILN